MSKIVKTVIIVAIAVAVVVFAPQIAGVLASVAGSLGVTVAASAISSALIGMGISMALTAAATLFRKAPSMSQSMADRLNTSVVPTASRKIIFGTTAGGADVRFFEGDLDLPSTKKDGYVQVVALASHRINALKQFYVENDLVWQNGTFVSKRNGFAPNNPFRVVTEGKPGNSFSVGSGRYWNSSSTFTGCAYYVPFWKLDDEVWESGIPQRLTAIVEGCPLYDPRRDSTRGGSGAHRVNDQNTYAFRDGSIEIGRNPALALLTYLLGWRINGKVVWGMGIPANRIDFDNFRTYANLCEERVAVQGGGTVQRYAADGIFSTTDSHETVINGLTAAMGSCKLTDRGGTYCIVGGYDDTAGPKVAFDADDLVAPANGSSPYIWNPAPASRERFNIVRGRFANPDELYQLTDWGDPIEREPLADGIPRTMSIDLGAVSRAETCQRIAKQMLLREYLCPGMFAATFGPKAFAVEIGSVITLSLPAEGWNNKLFRVMEQAESHDLFFQMTLREEDPAIYAWDREEKPLPANIRPQGYDASTTIAPANLALTSASYAGANGINVSEVHVTWTPELSGRVNGIQIQSRPAGTDAWSEQAALFDSKIGMFTFTSNAPGITVEVQARFRMMSAVYSPWVNASVATAPVLISYDSVDGTPGNLADINPTEGDKLDGIQDGATVGAPVGTNVGSIPVSDLVSKIGSLTAAGFTDDQAPPSPTGLTLSSVITDAGTTLNIGWNAVNAADLSEYVIALQEGAGSAPFIEYTTTGNSYSRTAIPRNVAITAKVLAFDKAGNRSAFSATVSHTTAKDNVAPAAPTNLSVEPSFTTGFVSFTAPADSDVSRVQINLLKDGVALRHVSVNVRPGMNGTATFSNLNRSTEYGVQALAIDTSDNVSPATNTVLFTTSGGISIADFTPGLSGITTVATLPSPISYTGATTVFDQTDGKLWNYSGGAWVVAVDASVADDSITVTKITNGAISTPKLAALAVTVDKLAAGSVTTDKLVAGAVQAAQIAAGAITVDKLLVTSMSELNPDPGFKDITYWLNRGVLNAPMGLGPGSVAGWYSTHDAGMNAIMGTRNYAMLWGGYFNSTGRQHLYSPRCYNMKGGATYQLGFTARNASNQYFTVITRMYDVNGALLADAALAVSINPVKTAFNVQFLAPANVISYEFIVFNASGTAYTGDMEITDLQLLEAVGGTAIRNGAITTDKIVANAITADKILGGTITGDKFNTGTSLPGTITVGNTGVAIGTTAAQAANGGTMKWYDASSGNQYNFYGTRIQRDAPTNGWHSNAYTTEGFRNAAKISAQMDTPDTFIGLATGRPYNNVNDYQQINYSIHRSSNGTVYAYEYGAAYALVADAGNGIVYSIIYDGKSVSYVRDNDNATLRVVGAPAAMTVFGAVSLYSQGSAVSRVAMTGGMDNSLNGSDPAARINAYSTTIDPGRVLIQGGTTLDAWRDQTEIRGGAIKTNSVSAEKIAINARGISVIGCDFEYSPNDGRLYWRDGHVLYTDDAGNPASPYIPAGSVAWGGGSYNYIMWDKGAGGFRQVVDNWEQAQVRNSNSIIMCTWRNGPSFVANYGGTIVHGDRITTRTINADRMNVNSLSAISANVGTVTAGLVRSSNGNAYFDLDNARIVFNNGSVMKVQGVGFGSTGQFIEWFGPVQSSFTSCTEANATYYLKTNGSAYFGGSLSAGVLKNSVQTTSQAYDASVTTGTFGSNGKSRVVTVGYQASSSTNITGSCPTPYTPYATIRLYRGTTASGTLLAEQTFNGSHACSPGAGQSEPGSMIDGIGGSITYTDNTGGSSSSYFVQIVGRNIMTTNLSQSLGVTSVEQ